MGAGELLVTSMDKDGTKSGFDIELYKQLGDLVQVPIIASGGAGTVAHFVEVFQNKSNRCFSGFYIPLWRNNH